MSITTMKLALEALDKIYDGCGFVIEDKLHKDAIELAKLVRKDCFEPITALRQAIEQSEQAQPMAWVTAGPHTSPLRTHWEGCEAVHPECKAEQAQQYVMQNAQGELERISLVQTGVGIGTHPVAWMYDFLNPDSRGEVIRNWVTQDLSEIDGAQGFNVRPLYTIPPQRQPLDDLIILDLADKHLHDQETYQALAFARAIEREIKENK
jgi:hypothetical protein